MLSSVIEKLNSNCVCPQSLKTKSSCLQAHLLDPPMLTKMRMAAMTIYPCPKGLHQAHHHSVSTLVMPKGAR